MSPGRLVEALDRALYPDYQERWDSKLFRDYVRIRVASSSRVLDLGAGSGIVPEMNLRGSVARVCGIDPDPRVLDNPGLDEAKQALATDIPYLDQSFDAVIAHNVLEHLEAPKSVFAEVYRVLRPGGLFLSKTPNKWHYVALAATVTPYSLHGRLNGWRGRDSVDTFPTLYRANSKVCLDRYARGCGFKVVEIRQLEGRPDYLRFTPATYLMGWLYERIVNSVDVLGRFRVILISTFERPVKPAGQDRA